MTTKSTPGPPADDKFKSLKALLEKAGLSVDEAAHTFKVSRVSVYTWINEHGPQQPLIRSHALRVIALLEKVVASGDLPLVEVAKKDREQVLSAIFKKHLTPPPKAAPRAED